MEVELVHAAMHIQRGWHPRWNGRKVFVAIKEHHGTCSFLREISVSQG